MSRMCDAVRYRVPTTPVINIYSDVHHHCLLPSKQVYIHLNTLEKIQRPTIWQCRGSELLKYRNQVTYYVIDNCSD
jgi:hypothetical protein